MLIYLNVLFPLYYYKLYLLIKTFKILTNISYVKIYYINNTNQILYLFFIIQKSSLYKYILILSYSSFISSWVVTGGFL